MTNARSLANVESASLTNEKTLVAFPYPIKK